MKLGGKQLHLEKIKVPVYALATKEDHIAPAKSVYHGLPLFGGDVTFVLSASGHIAGVVNPPARNKYEYWTNENNEGTLTDWQVYAENHHGSWWPHWQNWLSALHNQKVAAREVGKNKTYPSLEDAPGSYVKVKG